MDSREFKSRVLPVSHKIYRYALRLLGNMHDAEDVVQDIWLRLWDRRDRLGDVKNIEAFAFRMTRNLCLDRIKLKKPQYYDDREEMAFRFEEADTKPDPEQSLQLKNTMEMLERIISNLPEQQQTLLHMREVEGLEYEEIAGMTGLEINTIRVNLSRARKKLRDTLNKWQER
jgi:RNA polymerase sigma-70 factor (ECF subfamily)